MKSSQCIVVSGFSKARRYFTKSGFDNQDMYLVIKRHFKQISDVYTPIEIIFIGNDVIKVTFDTSIRF